MKREQERQRNEVALSIPDDHPVRKLFQKFRQQRDVQTAAAAEVEPHNFSDHNCVQVEPPQQQQQHQHYNHHQHLHLQQHQHANQCQQQELVSTVQSKVACAVGGSLGVIVTSQTLICPEEPGDGAREAAAQPPLAGSGGSGATAGSAPRRLGARGWAKFKSAATAAPAPLAGDREKQPPKQKQEEKEEEEEARKNQEEAPGGEEAGAMHKTDSCDSGITQSDLRMDRASLDRSPLERSPLEKNSFDVPKQPPASGQALLHASLQQAKLELKGDIQALGSRLALLEAQVGEILRLLSARRRLSLPPTSSPRPRAKNQDASLERSKPGELEGDNGPF